MWCVIGCMEQMVTGRTFGADTSSFGESLHWGSQRSGLTCPKRKLRATTERHPCCGFRLASIPTKVMLMFCEGNRQKTISTQPLDCKSQSPQIKISQTLNNRIYNSHKVEWSLLHSIIFINIATNNLYRHISRALSADHFAMWNTSDSTQNATFRMQETHISRWATDWCHYQQLEDNRHSLLPVKYERCP